MLQFIWDCLNRPVSMAQFEQKHWGLWKLTEMSTHFRRKLLVKQGWSYKHLWKSTINKQWDSFKDTGETFRLRRLRTRDCRTSSHMGKSMFILFCLSEIRANDPSGLEWLENVSRHLGEKGCLIFKKLKCFVSNFFAPVNCKAHVWKWN